MTAELSQYEYDELRRKAALYDADDLHIKRIAKWVIVGIVVLFALFVFWRLVSPQMNLYRSNTEKQSVIKEQEAISDAAEYAAKSRVTQANAEAEARIIEAQAIADSQELIAATLTPEYLQWRYYEVLATTSNQVIYVPTEGALPITEAGQRPELPAEMP